MYRNILIGVDGGSNGRDAIALARRLAGPDSVLLLAHVYGGEHVPASGSASDSATQHADEMALLEHERSRAGVEAGLLSIGAPSVGRGLHHLAISRRADLIVVGSTRHGPVGRALLGDDIRGALGGAPCAVAIAPRGYARDAGDVERIGVAYNFSDAADAILLSARELAVKHGATLSALYVAPFPTLAREREGTPDFVDFVDAEHEMRAGLLEHLDGRVAYGQIGHKLAAFGDQVDLLVVGSRGRGPLRSMIFGSTSSYLARHAACAVLVMPRSGSPMATKELVKRQAMFCSRA
jgi:nucleotide-binding universal stress UspA family protein